MSAPVFVRIGASTPLGLTAGVTVRAVAAGMARFRDTDVLGGDGRPIRGSFFPDINTNTIRQERILFFAERALQECLEGLAPNAFGNVVVLVVLPELERGAALQTYDIVRSLEQSAAPLGLSLDFSRRPILSGRAGFFQALETARSIITEQQARAVAIVGADSYCDTASLEQLEVENRALSAENPDGLIPGEGAGCVLLAEAITARSARVASLATLDAVALGRDDDPVEKRTGAHGSGISAVFKKLRATNTAGRTDAIFSCQTGEGIWGRELSIAYMRNAALMPEPKVAYLLAENLGDTGAAAGPIQLGVCLHLHTTSYRRKRKLDRAVLYGAADGGDVGGAIVGVVPGKMAV